MLDIQMEPRRGILFIRLSGSLTRKTINLVNKKVIHLVKNIGVKNIVFNLEGVSDIDNYGMNVLVKSKNICLRNKGNVFICTKNKKKFDKFNVVEDELKAIELINA